MWSMPLVFSIKPHVCLLCGFHTKHLILQAVDKSPTGPRGDEVDRVRVQFFFGSVVSPLPA